MGLLNIFFPSRHNGKRSSLLHHSTLLGYILFASALIFTTHVVSYKFPNVLGFASNISATDLLYYTNQARTENNLGALKPNEKLNKAALEKAQDMFNNDYWAHVSPSGTQPWDFINKEGYDYFYAGENLARDFEDSKDVVDAWLNSPSHRENVLNNHYEDIGFAILNGTLEGKQTTLVVQMFGKSRVPEYTALNEPEVDSYAIQKSGEAFLAVSNTPLVDLNVASRGITFFLLVFILLLFILDVIYIKKYQIVRISGNTFVHLIFLILALVGIWYSNIGIIL